MSDSYSTVSLRFAVACLVCNTAVSAQTPTRQVPLEGPAVYKAYCGSCHGPDGKGNGPAAAALKFKPADLTTIAKNNKGVFPRVTIEDVLQNGGKWKGHGSKEMPTWGPVFLADNEDAKAAFAHLDNLVTYLEFIQVK